MANFVVIVDPEPERRSRFIQTIEPLLPPVEDLVINSCAIADFQAIWAANPQAPISYNADAEGAAVIWGEAIPQNKSTRTNAANLRNLWDLSTATQSFVAFDGFYAAVTYQPHLGLVVGADLLGLYPVYYYAIGDVTLVASSPELFRYHPLFKVALNPVGLVEILLINGLFENQTLWQDVYRLGAGNLLVKQPEKPPSEIKQNTIPGSIDSNQYSHLSFAEHLDILEETLEKVVARHAPLGEKYALLISGGLDSRMLGGFLLRQGNDMVAMTLGERSDVEMKCAVPVVRTLGLKHNPVTVPLTEYPTYIDLLAKWEHLVNGSSLMISWGLYPHLRKLAPKIITGYSLGLVFGCHSAFPVSSKTLCFDEFFASLNSWGFSPELLKKLLRKEVFGDLVEETIPRIKAVYESYSDLELRRAWWFDLFHRQRTHVGGGAWQMSFGAWPTLVYLDWEVLATTAALPNQTMAGRVGQEQLMCTRFPELAKLPLDRADFYVEPILQTKMRKLLYRVYRYQEKWRTLQNKFGIERRYFHRIFDINNQGWQTVRQQAEPYREKVYSLFNEEILNQILPKPDERVSSSKLSESGGMKDLLSFLIWSKNHL